MKKIKTSIRNKELLTLGLIILAFFLIRLALLFIGAKLGETREDELNQLKMNALMDIVSSGNSQRAAADERLSDHVEANVNLMTNLLKELVTEDGYIGPRVFPGAFVAELRGGSVILPEEYREFRQALTREMIEDGLSTGHMMNAVIRIRSATQEDPQETETYFLSFGEITENEIFADVMTESEYNAYLERYSYDVYEALESGDAAFGGITLAVQERDGEVRIINRIGASEEDGDLYEPELTAETIREKTPVLTMNGQEYLCAYDRIESRSTEGESLHLIQMIPRVSLREQNFKRALLVSIVMVIIFIAITLYVISVQRFTAEHELTEELAARYQPDRMRRRMFAIGVLSVLITFASALLIESVGQLYMELRYGRDTLRIFSRQNQERQRSIEAEEESWYVNYGGEMASLLADYPALASPENLEESCGILGIDYIMLFDSEGGLTLCNRDYAGYTLTDEENSELYDFRRLLYGLPSLVSASSEEGMTGLERKLIGVKTPAEEAMGMHGALIMALMPDATQDIAFGSDDRSMTVARGTYCFAADSESGEILYSSSAPLVGKRIGECGLPESSLRDGYMDFTSIGGSGYLVITSRDGDCVYYYAVESGTMFEHVLQYGVIVAILFGLILALMLFFLLGGYNEKAVQEWTELRAQSSRAEALPDSENGKEWTGKLREKSKEGEKQSAGILQGIAKYLHWDQMLPGEKVRVVLRVSLIILLICCLDVLHGKQLTNESYHTMLGFLLHGDWMRGANLFCVCSILLVIAFAYLINLLSSLLLRLSAGLSAEHGMTISRLLYSCVKYITVFGVIYFSLEYLGFPTSTIVASLGVVSLAISLGAQDLIADILAGLAIVFDGSFQVGDVVKINGTRGTIMEIGVRSTRMKVPVNNIMIINNHEIKDIVNMSKELSEYKQELRISCREPLLKLEELLNRELPLIGAKNDKIVEGPYLLGVTALENDSFSNGPTIKLTIGAMIHERDSYQTMLFLNREIKLLFEREEMDLL